MKAIQKMAVLMLLGIFSMVIQVQAQDMKMSGDHIMVMPNDIKWAPAPPGLPPGSQAAVIEGDPGAAGLFTMRAKIPANYRIMPHWHPADEHITVLKGSCYMGMGDEYDEKTATKMTTGAFAVMKTGTHHYFFTKEECIIQLHGMGPWGITYINPADDPRNKK
ncbi:cupin domain-containing protein [Flavobacterium sp. ZS1P14]|uniref:cupin domain-containing protein n=1 Tax=Flavobacterium sp. ZS1P14 TaxID=3401729 RepID=UPI003AAE02DC